MRSNLHSQNMRSREETHSLHPGAEQIQDNDTTFLLTATDVFSKVARWVPLKKRVVDVDKESAGGRVSRRRSKAYSTYWYRTGIPEPVLEKYGIHNFSTNNKKPMRASSYDSFTLERLACGDTSQSTRRADVSTCYRTSSAPRTTLRTDRRFEKVSYRMGPTVAIREVHPSEPPIYRLSDDLGETLGGTFYEPKLPKVTAPAVTLHRVESMLQRCKVEGRRQMLVHWFGSRPSLTAGLMPRPSSTTDESVVDVAEKTTNTTWDLGTSSVPPVPERRSSFCVRSSSCIRLWWSAYTIWKHWADNVFCR